MPLSSLVLETENDSCVVLINTLKVMFNIVAYTRRTQEIWQFKLDSLVFS